MKMHNIAFFQQDGLATYWTDWKEPWYYRPPSDFQAHWLTWIHVKVVFSSMRVER